MEEQVSIGTLLRNAREQKKLKLEDIANKTKININILKALEENDVHHLPNIAYLKGFVKNYAKAVGVNEEIALNSLQSTLNIEENIKPTVVTNQTENLESELHEQELKENIISIAQSFLNKKIILAVVVVVVVVSVLKTVVNWFAELNFERNKIAQMSEQKTDPAEPAVLKDENANILEMDGNKKFADKVQVQNSETQPSKDDSKKIAEQQAADEQAKKLAEQKAQEEAKKLAEQKAQEEAKKLAEQKAAQEEAAKKLAEKKALEAKANETKPADPVDGKFPYREFSAVPAKTFDIVKDAPEVNDPEILPPNFKAAVEPDKENVFIHAVDDDTWISYKADDAPIKRFVLQKGRKVLIKGKVIRLFMGNFNVAKLFYNNQLLDIRSTRSGVRSMIFPQSEAVNFKLPLFPVYKGKSYTPEEYIENMASKTE